jgi:hypothetical protein
MPSWPRCAPAQATRHTSRLRPGADPSAAGTPDSTPWSNDDPWLGCVQSDPLGRHSQTRPARVTARPSANPLQGETDIRSVAAAIGTCSGDHTQPGLRRHPNTSMTVPRPARIICPRPACVVHADTSAIQSGSRTLPLSCHSRICPGKDPLAGGILDQTETTACPGNGRAARLGSVLPGQRWRRMRDSNSRGLAPNTLPKSVGLSSPKFERVRDLGRPLRAVCAERLRTYLNETKNETASELLRLWGVCPDPTMRTTTAHDDRTASAASKRCLRSRTPAVVCPCCDTSCCTELTLECQYQGRPV